MQLETVAAGLVWIWSLVALPADARANLLVFDQPRIEQPRSARFVLDVNVTAGPQSLSVRGEGAVVQPDRAQLRLSALGDEFEVVAIGQTVYQRGDGDPDWSEIQLEDAADQLGTGPLTAALGPDERPDPDDLERALFQLFGEHQLVGESVRAGAPSEHYQSTLNRARLEELVGASGEGGDFVLELLGGFSLTLDYYVGKEDRYVRGARLAAEFEPPAAMVGSERLSLVAELGLSDFDTSIEILPPTAAEPARPAPVEEPVPAPVQAPVQMPAGAAR